MHGKVKKSSSILLQALQASPHPGQPLYSIILLFSIVLDVFRIILRFFLALFSVACFSAIVVGMIAWVKLKPEYDAYIAKAEETVSETGPGTFRFNETTEIYYSDGSRMADLKRDSDTIYLEYENIPGNVVKAFVAVEDRTFWENPGIDLKSIVKVAYDALVSRGEKLRGASTITQQLARSVFLSNGVTIDRKLQEMALSIKLTEKYSKEQIMEFYVNNAYFANGYYGIEAASQGYFSKASSSLTLSETAYLCAIPNSPTFFDPFNDLERAVSRRDHILESMYDVGFISWNDMEAAKEEEIYLSPKGNRAGGYDVTYAADCAIRYFMGMDGFNFQYHFDTDEEQESYKNSFSTEYENMREELYRGGYRINTSINRNIQQKLQEITDKFIMKNRDENADDLQAAMVLSDEKGKIEAIIGGVTQEGAGFGLNRAFQSYRQPGSAVKPIIVYTPALENGYTPETLVKNISISEAHSREADRINFGTPYSLDELAGQHVTLRYALEKSLNGVSYVLMDSLGIGNTVPYLEKLHFSNIVPGDYTLSSSLGGLTYGASAVEMCGAYSCLANGGFFNEPTCITGITDRYGREIYHAGSSETVYEKESSDAMADLMEGVMLRGTGASLGWYEKTDWKAYVKTGTTNNQKDGWMCGWAADSDNNKKVMAVWVGCDIPKELKALWGNTWPGELWMETMLNVMEQ